MLIAMKLHRLGIDVRVERVIPELQRRKLARHVGGSLISAGVKGCPASNLVEVHGGT
jgi:hypothetical protein